jgi:hypothetical protein
MTRKELEKPKEPKEVTFPVAGFINQYHFCRISDKVLAKLGWTITGKRLAIEFDVNDKNDLVIRKPSK